MENQIINLYNKNGCYDQEKDYQQISTILGTYGQQIENKYYLYVTNNDEIQKLFTIFIFYYLHKIEINNQKKVHIAIDFEFNNQKVALMQLKLGKYIWITNPNHPDIKIFTKKILLNDKIYKIFHGAESLDLPYIFNDLLKNDSKKIFKFIKKYIDTRFLCEYVRHSLAESGRCSIYDAMLYFNIINQDKYKILERINKSLGPIQNTSWDINFLNDKKIKYAYYDVIYLDDLLFGIYDTILNQTPSYSRSYYYIIEIIRFVILERTEVTTILKIISPIVNQMNIYFVKINNETIRLVDIFDRLHVVVEDGKGSLDIDFIKSNNYVRGIMNYLLKYITYCVIGRDFEIFINKKETMSQYIEINILYNKLEEYGFMKMVKLLRLYEKGIKYIGKK